MNNNFFSINVYEGNPKKIQTGDGEITVPTFWIKARINNLDYLYHQSFRFYSDAIDKSEELYDYIIDIDDWELFEVDAYENHLEYLLDDERPISFQLKGNKQMFILNEIYSYTFRSNGVIVLETKTNEYVGWFPTLTEAIDSLNV